MILMVTTNPKPLTVTQKLKEKEKSNTKQDHLITWKESKRKREKRRNEKNQKKVNNRSKYISINY